MKEKYFFDLTGYLVVRGALTPEEVDRCNAAIDHYAEKIAPVRLRMVGLPAAHQHFTDKQDGWS